MKTLYTLDTNGQRQISWSLSVAFVRVPFWIRLVWRLSQRPKTYLPLPSHIYCTAVVVQLPSRVQLCDPMDCSTPGLPVPHHLQEFAQHHVHCISDAVQSSHPLTPFSFCPWSFPASGTFPTSHLFASDDQNTGVSASALVLPVNIQGWSPLRLTDLISLLSKGPSGVFSSTTIQRHRFFGVLPSLRSSSHNRTWPLGRPYPWLYGPLSAE